MDTTPPENKSPCAICRNHIRNTLNCKAFPNGIPNEILINEFDHTQPFGGEQEQNGKPILFESINEK